MREKVKPWISKLIDHYDFSKTEDLSCANLARVLRVRLS